MKRPLLLLAVRLLAGTSRATLPSWLDDGKDSDVSAQAKAKAAKMKTPDATVVEAPKNLIQLPAKEGDHLLDLARRVVSRGDVTLAGKVGDSDKYDAFVCEENGTSQVAVVAKADTCTRVFPSKGSRVVALEVLADLHSDGSRAIKGLKVFSGFASEKAKKADLYPDDGVWIRSGRVVEYTNLRQLSEDGQSMIRQDLDVWDRITTGMMGLDDSCYDGSGGTCG